MKSLLLIGGLLGFSIGLVFSWVQECSWPSTLWHACLAAYLSGLLLRWWARAWVRNLESAFLDRSSEPAPVTPVSLTKATKS
jgi:hypothetical protein